MYIHETHNCSPKKIYRIMYAWPNHRFHSTEGRMNPRRKFSRQRVGHTDDVPSTTIMNKLAQRVPRPRDHFLRVLPLCLHYHLPITGLLCLCGQLISGCSIKHWPFMPILPPCFNFFAESDNLVPFLSCKGGNDQKSIQIGLVLRAFQTSS
jgi:hypothetical protein